MAVLDSPQNVLNGVDYFKAKLQFEQTPHGLDHIMRLGTVLVLDVRDKASFEKEHIPGAINIPLDELPKRINELPKDKTIVCYCFTITCALAPRAALELAHQGYKVQEMVGGIDAWKKSGFKVEGSAAQKREPAQARGGPTSGTEAGMSRAPRGGGREKHGLTRLEEVERSKGFKGTTGAGASEHDPGSTSRQASESSRPPTEGGADAAAGL